MISVNHLADVTEGRIFRGREEEGETWVFSGEHVGVVDTVVAGGAKGCVIGGAKHRCFVFITDVTVDLHFTTAAIDGYGENERKFYRWVWDDKIT